MTQDETCLVVDSNPAEVPHLQARLLTLCGEAGLDDLAGFQLTSAVVEAVNNCIEHAFRGETGHQITLRWIRQQDQVSIEIRDQGESMPAPPAESPELPEPDAESGRGWHIIHEWTDRVTYARQGNENVLTLTRRL